MNKPLSPAFQSGLSAIGRQLGRGIACIPCTVPNHEEIPR